MNVTDVTTEGQRGGRPGRDAVTGASWAVGSDGSPADHRSPPDRAPSARAAADGFDSYYGRPVLNPPVWKSREIAGYFFLGGLAGASSTMAAAAQATGRSTLARRAKVGAAAASAVSIYALVKDLGVPSRFYNMLRVVRPTSPMNVGSWLLGAYVPAATAAAGAAVTGRFRRLGLVATGVAGIVGPAVASYTGALVADTAVPAWHDGHREMPLLFAASGASAAAGLGLVVAPVAEAAPARRLAAVATTAELVLLRQMERRMGMVAEPYHQGAAGRLLDTSERVAIAGVVVGAIAGRRSRIAAVASGTALLVASALTRFGVFEAGMRSAEDPKYTIVPQRERADRHDGAGAVRPRPTGEEGR